ncbi:hypothetical protein PR048_019099 [Dryococelus australis]|uniref:Uncharacterized protein n=1 Tax=Dryococelus australis TaxID=614101 RepID=A0ABQ9H2I9_9NEOP|nr:hypothetical protein PR048_019099 [Dryococelus australis]
MPGESPTGSHDLCLSRFYLSEQLAPSLTSSLSTNFLGSRAFKVMVQGQGQPDTIWRSGDVITRQPAGTWHLFQIPIDPDRPNHSTFILQKKQDRWSTGFLGDLPFRQPLNSGSALYSLQSSPIGSQDLAVKSRPNLFTHSLYGRTFVVRWQMASSRFIYVTARSEARMKGCRATTPDTATKVNRALTQLRDWLDIRLPPRRTGFNSRRGRSRIFARGNRAGRCRWSVGFLGGILFLPALHSGTVPYPTRFILIGSQYLDVKSHPQPQQNAIRMQVVNHLSMARKSSEKGPGSSTFASEPSISHRKQDRKADLLKLLAYSIQALRRIPQYCDINVFGYIDTHSYTHHDENSARQLRALRIAMMALRIAMMALRIAMMAYLVRMVCQLVTLLHTRRKQPLFHLVKWPQEAIPAFAWRHFGKTPWGPKSGCPSRESNPGPPECESIVYHCAISLGNVCEVNVCGFMWEREN